MVNCWKTWETIGKTSNCVKLAGCAERVNKIKMILTKTRITGIDEKSLVSAVFTRCVHRDRGGIILGG